MSFALPNHFEENDRDQAEDIEERVEELISLLQEEGAEAVVEEVSFNGEPSWSAEMVGQATDEETMVYKLSRVGDDFIAGVQSIEQVEGWVHVEKFENEIVPYNFYTVLIDDFLLTVGSAELRDDEESILLAEEMLIKICVWFGILTLVLALTLSAYVDKRLVRIRNGVAGINENNAKEELDTAIRNDEFGDVVTDINLMLHRLERMRQNIDEVSIGIAHDLKTPLTHLSNQFEVMAGSLSNPKQLEANIQKGREEIGDILETFDALLRLGEIDSGRDAENFTSINLSTLLIDLAESYEPVFSEAGKQLDVSVVQNQFVTGDEGLINQLVSNLLENSIVHSRAQGNTWLRLQASKDGLRLQIGDDGPGIPENLTEKIFDRFYRVDSSRGKPGNGLGLSLVKAICRLHSASLELLPNQPGLVFDIVFPIKSD